MPRIQPKTPEKLDAAFLRHLRDLGLGSVKEYRRWCTEHGFSRGIKKHSRLRSDELAAFRSIIHADQNDRRRFERRHPSDVLLGLCRGTLSESDTSLPGFRSLARAIKASYKSTGEPTLHGESLTTFVSHLVSVRAKFLDDILDASTITETSGSTLNALLYVVRYRRMWVRDLDTWKPRSRSPRKQFAALLRHLFARYDDLPAFFDAAWFASNGAAAANRRRWYIDVAAGGNIRHCNLPIKYTKRMAHYFMRSPNTVTIDQAVRWGQVRGLGGSERLSKSVISTRLGDDFANDDFWITVLRWLIDQPMLDPIHVGPIIDFIHHQRFVPVHALIHADDARALDDPGVAREPNFTMRGRTPETLLRQVDRWHNRLATDNRHQARSWTRSPIGEFQLIEGATDSESLGDNACLWTIRELLSTSSLVAEGRSLRHCVASYANSCAHRLTSIWTLEKETNHGIQKLLTVEVNPRTKAIIQVRGRNNRLATQQEQGILRRWASKAGLKITAHMR